jgi:branched-chain amino acid transport system substrate-binding protein
MQGFNAGSRSGSVATTAALAVLTVVALVVGGCGGSMTRADIISAMRAAHGSPAPGDPAASVTGTAPAEDPAVSLPVGAPGGGGSPSGSTPPAGGGAAPAAATPVSPVAGTAIAPSGSPPVGRAKSTAAATPPIGEPNTAPTGGTAPGGGATPAPGPEAARPGRGTPAAASGTPLLLAQVGTWSGPIGAAFKDLITGVRVWVSDVNARGGVAGHPVQLVVADDGSDPARYQALLKEMVETRGAFAFVANNVVFTGPAGKEYLEGKRVPVVGGDMVNPVWTSSSMYFPEGTTLTEIAVAVPVANARFSTRKKVGIITCQEVEGCRVASRVWPEYSKKLGLEVVYSSQASVAQPDFTAECIGARNAGADVMQLALDAASLIRWGKACNQLGFRPQVIIPSAAVESKLQGDVAGGIFEGLIGAINDAPFMVTDQPGPAAFQAAMAKYAGSAPIALSTLEGWTSGKLFERAGAALGPQATRDQLLNGLWSLQNETLGGLTPPLTFAREKPSPPVACFFVIKISDKKFTAPNGSQQVCP